MRKLTYSVALALLLVAAFAITVYSQRTTAANDEMKVLVGGVSHQLPMDLTLVIPTDSGPQTVTVPIVLNLNLTVGPLSAIHMDIQAEQAAQFVSPLQVIEPLSAGEAITAGVAITN
jgi:hypothetical protein